MDAVIKQYSAIVEKLKPFINKPGFDQTVAKIGTAIPKQKVFLIKMELKRLAQPTRRPLDLRGKVAGDCTPYEHQGVKHFLDEVGREVFEREVKLFGAYTVGVMEAVLNAENTFKHIQQKEKEAKLAGSLTVDEEKEIDQAKPESPAHQVPTVLFAHTISRKEERMNFVINVELVGPSGEKIPASTIDISVGGCRIKCKEEVEFEVNTLYGVFLRGLEAEYALNRRKPIPYEVMKVEEGEDGLIVALKRDVENSSSEVNSFLEKFIHGYKRRYKINQDNTEGAVRYKMYEQHYTPNIASLPVFLEIKEGALNTKFVMTNNSNKELLGYWTDDEDRISLNRILSASRVKRALQFEVSSFLLFCFKQEKNGKVFYCSATEFELQRSKTLLDSFLSLGSKKPSWRVFQVQVTDISADQAHEPLTIPESVSEKVKRMNAPPPPRVTASIANLRVLALLTDVTAEDSTARYQKRTLTRTDSPMLSKFVHPIDRNGHQIEVHPYKFADKRMEARYMLNSGVNVTYDGKIVPAKTLDVSQSGMLLELDEAMILPLRAVLALELHELQAMSPKNRLDRLTYQIRNITNDGKLLHLKAYEPGDNKKAKPHQGKAFFSDLIKQNRDKLKEKVTEDTSGYSKALRNIFIKNVFNMALFFRKDGVHLAPTTMVTSAVPNRLWALFSYAVQEMNEFTILPFIGREHVRNNWLSRAMKDLKAGSGILEYELLISFDDTQEEPLNAFEVRSEESFDDETSRQLFVANTVEKFQFFALKLFLIKTGRPDAENLSAELNYVQAYAPHKAKTLEAELWGQFGFVNVVNITDEVRLRYKLPATVEAPMPSAE